MIHASNALINESICNSEKVIDYSSGCTDELPNGVHESIKESSRSRSSQLRIRTGIMNRSRSRCVRGVSRLMSGESINRCMHMMSRLMSRYSVVSRL